MAWYDSIAPEYVRNVANSFWQEVGFDVFDVFPKLTVRKDYGMIGQYSVEDLMRIGNPDDFANIPGAPVESKGITLASSYEPYTLLEYRTHRLVTKTEVEDYEAPFRPIADATQDVVGKLDRITVKVFAQKFMTTGVWGADKAGGTDFTKWDDANSDPQKDVLAWKAEVLSQTGFEPNVLAVTYDVYAQLLTNSAVRSLLKVTDDKVVTADKLAKLFDLDRVAVMRTVETTAQKGKTKTSANTGFVKSKSALLVYRPEVASRNKPSGGYAIVKASGITTKSIPQPDKNDALKIEGAVTIAFKSLAPSLGVFASDVIS